MFRNSWRRKQVFLTFRTELKKMTRSSSRSTTNIRVNEWLLLCTILDINYVELEGAFIYIIHKPLDFSHRLKTFLGHMVIGLKQVRVPIGT